MAAIPTVLYLGDTQISGGAVGTNRAILGTTGDGLGTLVAGLDNEVGKGWHVGRHNYKFNKVVPSGADGVSGGTFQPYWDGTANAGAGLFVQFHPVPTGNPPGAELTNILPLAYGDNWYEGTGNTGAVTPCAMLMHSLWARWPGGFKMFKFATNTGFGGATGWGVNAPGSSLANALFELDLARQALGGGDTMDVKAIIIDCSTTDLFNINATYLADAQNFITIVRSAVDSVTNVTCTATTPIILVNHHQDMLNVSAVSGSQPLIRLLRRYNADLARDNANVYLFDMNWATDWQSIGVQMLPVGSIPFPNGLNAPGVEQPDKRWYAPETYLQAGIRLGRTLDAIWAGSPQAAPGSAIPVVVMIGDSQFVGQIDPLMLFYTEQESLLGPVGGTDREFQWIWNAQTNQVVPYDVMANSNTFGTATQAGFGPDSTLLKNLAEEFPTGVVVFKYARNGVSLTTEANGANNALESTANIWPSLIAEWNLFKQECLNQLGRSPDCIGIVTDIGGNDEGTLASYTAFGNKVGTWIEDLRANFATRATGGALPIVWLQPPPHVDSGGNSTHNNAAGANAVRAAIAALPSQYDNVSVVLNSGEDKYELKRNENVHYGGEANLQIGYDLADSLIALVDSAAGANGAGAGGGVDEGIDGPPSEAASFVVETGTGSATANSYCTEAFATTYHETYGNPDAWLAASTFDHQDALRQATRALDIRYGSWWSGVRAGSTQALDWPRAYAFDAAGNPIPATTIPTRLQQATAILALLHIQGESILPSTSTTADIKSETLSSASGASKSVTYIGGKRADTQFPIIDRMLSTSGLTSGGAGWGWLDL